MKIAITKDLLSGALFACTGAAALVIASGYRLGAATRMGPGYFPTIIATVLMVVGASLILRSLLSPSSSDTIVEWKLRPLAFVIAGILSFGLLIKSAGVIAAISGLLLFSRFAGKPSSLADFAAMVMVMCAVVVGVFAYGLSLPMRLFPW